MSTNTMYRITSTTCVKPAFRCGNHHLISSTLHPSLSTHSSRGYLLVDSKNTALYFIDSGTLEKLRGGVCETMALMYFTLSRHVEKTYSTKTAVSFDLSWNPRNDDWLHVTRKITDEPRGIENYQFNNCSERQKTGRAGVQIVDHLTDIYWSLTALQNPVNAHATLTG